MITTVTHHRRDAHLEVTPVAEAHPEHSQPDPR